MCVTVVRLVEDEVQERRGLGSFADGLAFAAYTPQNESAVEVLASFSPVSLVFHQVKHARRESSRLCSILTATKEEGSP